MGTTLRIDASVKVKSGWEEQAVLIGELAERAQTSTRSVRYYEQQGLLESSRDANGYRRFDERDVLTVRQIRGLLAAGFSTDAIAKLLPCARGERPEIDLCPEVVAQMTRVLAQIDAEMSGLAGRQQAITRLLKGAPAS